MGNAQILRIYLEPDELKRARDGQFNLMNRIKSAFEWQGFRVDFMRNSQEQRLKSADRNGYSLFFMQDPFHERALNLRRAYYYPFWRIENTAERWKFRVAQAGFDLGVIDTNAAKNWADNWRKWLFKGAASAPTREGVVYIPLQGLLLEHRSFQSASPIQMIKAVLKYDQNRKIILGLHPGESYSDKEMNAVNALIADNPRISLIKGGADDALRCCDYVVTENSSAALSGFFFHKPAILFAKIDFHHIGLNVSDLGVQSAFEQVTNHYPAYDEYLYWFIQMNALKADTDTVEEEIIRNVRELGWDV